MRDGAAWPAMIGRILGVNKSIIYIDSYQCARRFLNYANHYKNRHSMKLKQNSGVVCFQYDYNYKDKLYFHIIQCIRRVVSMVEPLLILDSKYRQV